MGSWPVPVSDGLATRRPGPKFQICEPQGPAVGENGPSASVSVKEMIQQVFRQRVAFEDAWRKNLVGLESVEKAKEKARSRLVDHLCATEGNCVAIVQSSSSESKIAQDIVRGVEFLEERLSGEEVSVSEELVQGLHFELFRLHKSVKGLGQLRTCYAYSRKDNDIHWFPPPHVIPSCFGARLKKHNHYISKKTTFADQHSPEYIDFVCRCAASLLYDFVELHPFKDGNGLVAHLLVNSVLRLVAPFPVCVRIDFSTLNEQRPANLDTICHEGDSGKPDALALGLLQGLWHGWKWFAAQLDSDK